MSYKIAIASHDGVLVDMHFGYAKSFIIIQVDDDGSYKRIEDRVVPTKCNDEMDNLSTCGEGNSTCGSNFSRENAVNARKCKENHHNDSICMKVLLLSDCRCLICTKIGPGAKGQLEQRAITTFEIDCRVQEALAKIIEYYTKIDNHKSLRKSIIG